MKIFKAWIEKDSCLLRVGQAAVNQDLRHQGLDLKFSTQGINQIRISPSDIPPAFHRESLSVGCGDFPG